MQLQTKLHACVEGYHVNTLAAYNEFMNVTLPKNKNGWDIVILDRWDEWCSRSICVCVCVCVWVCVYSSGYVWIIMCSI